TITRPDVSATLFCPQQPYLPLGSLRSALAYPDPVSELDDTRAVEALRAVQLGHLVDRLDESADWAKTLSPGEQQRIAFGRVLIERP
ncbi:ABC transporter ATP-binding protein/permease, partial [Acinetobacter baumannii]|nr:ABC transporter ATP-binding protein/permease [Acinetobacter baumannii]